MARLKLNNPILIIKNDLREIEVQKLSKFSNTDLEDLSYVAEQALHNDSSFYIGFKNSLKDRASFEKYFQNILIIPNKLLFVVRFNKIIVGAIQLIATDSLSITIENHFIAPWLNNFNIAEILLKTAEYHAKELNAFQVRLSIRADLINAINFYEEYGYRKWGTLEKYTLSSDGIIAGHFYYKDI